MKEQTELPAMKGPGVEEIPGNPYLEELAERYAEARDARQAATRPEADAKQRLVDALHVAANENKLARDQKTGTLTYKNEGSGILITLTPSKEKLKVKIKGEGDEDEEGEVEVNK
jgi:hypothetical protein